MDKKRITMIPMFVAIILVLNVLSVFSDTRTDLPYYIKIGLFFDKTAKSTLSLESNSGFNVGIFQEEEFFHLFNIDDGRILLRKDKPYMGQGVDFKELDQFMNIQMNVTNIEGAHHIQLGQNFRTYVEAYEFLTSLNEINIQGYLSYEDEWKVFTGMYLDEFSAQEEATKIQAMYGVETKIIHPSSTRVQVLGQNGNTIFMYDSVNEIYFAGKENSNTVPLVNVEGKNYRGAITAKRLSNSDMTIINKLPLEEYLYGVVPGEMPALWPLEALKAQAVAARGYAAANLNKYDKFGFNLCATTYSQVYKGYDGEHPNTNRAVDETRSKVLTYDGKIIEPYYHSDSGGHTEDSENIWLNPLPYIRGVRDDFSLNTPHSHWSVSLSKEEIKSCLANNNIFIGDILDIKITSTSKNGRVLSLTVYGTHGQEVMEKEKSRLVFGLKSSQFTIGSNNAYVDDTELYILGGHGPNIQPIRLREKYLITANGIDAIEDIRDIYIFDGKEYEDISKDSVDYFVDPDVFVFNGKGYGHGLGMSQYGAKTMAEQGYRYDEILTHYYTGVKVE